MKKEHSGSYIEEINNNTLEILYEYCFMSSTYEQQEEETIDIIEEFHLSKIPGKFDCDTELNAEMLNTFDLKTRTHDLNVTFIKYSRR